MFDGQSLSCDRYLKNLNKMNHVFFLKHYFDLKLMFIISRDIVFKNKKCEKIAHFFNDYTLKSFMFTILLTQNNSHYSF